MRLTPASCPPPPGWVDTELTKQQMLSRCVGEGREGGKEGSKKGTKKNAVTETYHKLNKNEMLKLSRSMNGSFINMY